MAAWLGQNIIYGCFFAVLKKNIYVAGNFFSKIKFNFSLGTIFWPNPEKAKFPKPLFDNIGKKIKDDLF